MQLSEAYSILGIPENSTEDEAKKAYRKLAAKHHPDIDKSPGAEEHFKKINAAFDRIKSGEPDQPDFQNMQNNGWNVPPDIFSQIFNGGFGGFGNQSRKKTHQHIDIGIRHTISFNESVLGTTIPISLNYNEKCSSCDGEGQINLNKCYQCNNTGFYQTRQGNSIFTSPCSACKNNKKYEKCKTCNAKGTIPEKRSANVKVPAGILNNQKLQLSQMGNYITQQSFLGQTQNVYSDVIIEISVIPDSELSIKDNNVISSLPLTLLEAIQGCSKQVKTVLGTKEISIPPKSKNGEIIKIPTAGVARKFDHNITLNVSYPDNLDDLVSLLQKSSLPQG